MEKLAVSPQPDTIRPRQLKRQEYQKLLNFGIALDH
jgi:hypothetical protein